MSKRQKLLQRLRNNPKNVSFDDLVTLLGYYDILLERVRGSHHIFAVKIGEKVFTLPIPRHHPVNSTYIRKALELIEAIEASEHVQDDDDE